MDAKIFFNPKFNYFLIKFRIKRKNEIINGKFIQKDNKFKI